MQLICYFDDLSELLFKVDPRPKHMKVVINGAMSNQSHSMEDHHILKLHKNLNHLCRDKWEKWTVFTTMTN